MNGEPLKAPFPWFGGKSRIASEVWDRLGDVAVYAEPFAGSLAVLLGRPGEHNPGNRVETVNDLDGFVCLAPDTRVLRSNLRYCRVGDVAIGDRLIAFDEFNPGEKRPGFVAPVAYRRARPNGGS